MRGDSEAGTPKRGEAGPPFYTQLSESTRGAGLFSARCIPAGPRAGERVREQSELKMRVERDLEERV